MKRIFISIGRVLGKLIDFFYPLFKRYMSPQLFRYAVSGSLTLISSMITYFILYQFVIQKRVVNLPFIALSGHTAALIVNFVITLLIGFFLQKYVTFTTSDLRGRKQLVRYAQVGLLNLFLNYLGLKLMVEILHIFPSISNAIVSIVVTVVSYFLQTKYTFPINKNVSE
ncbi:MAG: GtrA family protein [Paludibacteraceae bacterium]